MCRGEPGDPYFADRAGRVGGQGGLHTFKLGEDLVRMAQQHSGGAGQP